MGKLEDVEAVTKVLRSHRNESIDINTVAKESGLSWFAAYRILTELIFEELSDKHKAAVKDLSIVPEMTTKGLMFRPQLAEEVA